MEIAVDVIWVRWSALPSLAHEQNESFLLATSIDGIIAKSFSNVPKKLEEKIVFRRLFLEIMKDAHRKGKASSLIQRRMSSFTKRISQRLF
ncbi:unnamed protein product [Caenorhabditis auriculariae]|uniref:Uncharacterized protein n=1 Tax=Caenorhabditis auriculariae TaxID=2777116 RepID=A0A8S1HSW0_9PELO|nr:unnamed protein product [Caenorhabditis auriculariae]